MSENTRPYVVTAFFDIGRGDWTPNKVVNGVNLPGYLRRDVSDYLNHFRRLAKIENPLVVFTSSELIDTIEGICRETRPPSSYQIFLHEFHEPMYRRIESVLKSKEFVDQINPHQKGNPEYWSADYVYVTTQKASFVRTAYQYGAIPEDCPAAWVDFGYIRTEDQLPVGAWNPDFDQSKIHLFSYNPPSLDGDRHNTLTIAIKNNIVYIIGGIFYASSEGWKHLSYEMTNQLLSLTTRDNLVDDDQGILLACYLDQPELFEIHQLSIAGGLENIRSVFRSHA